MWQSLYFLGPFSLYLNYKRKHLWASVWLIAISSMVEFGLCSTFGYKSGEHLNFIALFFGAFLIAPIQSVKDFLKVFAVPSISLSVLFITDFSLFRDSTIPQQVLDENFFFTFLNSFFFSGVLGFLFFRVSEKQETLLEKEYERHQKAMKEDFEAYTHSLMNNSLDAVIGIDLRSRVEIWNKRAEQMFGWSVEEAVGRPLAELVVPMRYRERHGMGIQKHQEHTQTEAGLRRLEIEAVDKLGREFPIELSLTKFQKGDTWSFIAFVRDLTEIKQAQTNLKNSEANLNAILDNTQASIW